jgi:hypothetical protein
MTTIQSIGSAPEGSYGVSVAGSRLLRYPPEPRSSWGSWAQVAGSTVGSVANTAANTGLGLGLGTDLTGLLNQQIQIQREMQVISMQSNISRSQHEMEMAPIRNMRIG